MRSPSARAPRSARRGKGAATLVATALCVMGLTAAPAQAAPDAYVSGWLPYWAMSEAYGTAVANADLLRAARPFWYRTGADGGVTGSTGAGDPSVVAGLRASGVAVVPTVTDAGLTAMTAAIAFTDPGWRSRHVAALVGLAARSGFDGLDLDYESIGTTGGTTEELSAVRTGFVSLVGELCTALHSQGRTCTVNVMPKVADGTGVFDYGQLAAQADRLVVMAYNEHWSQSAPGPIASLPWVTSVVQYALTRVPAAKLELGIPTFGRDWGSGSGVALRGSDLVATAALHGAAIGWDSVAGEATFTYTDAQGRAHVVYSATARSIADRVALARQFGLAGASLWTISGAPVDAWAAIRSVVPVTAYPGLLRYGSRGPAVATVQHALGISADGIFGPKTLAAVRAFQSAHGLVPDGIVGPRTWAAL